MFNPYSIILTLFVVIGVVVTLWGLRIIVMARKTLNWPAVNGRIEESALSSERDDLLPHIKFCYHVEQQTFRQLLKFPADITPTQEFAKSYVNKYPSGSHVQVYYNPANPEMATLEPGLGKGDWFVLAFGLGILLLGILLFISVG